MSKIDNTSFFASSLTRENKFQNFRTFHDWLKEDMKWSDAEIDEYLNEVWNCEYNIDGVTRSIREWASLMGEEALRKQLKPILTDKREAQKAAESI